MSEWVWHGHAAHFIGGARCRFHLATTVAGGRFIVSTVGDYYPDPKGERDQTAQDATAGHMALCRKWDKRTEYES